MPAMKPEMDRRAFFGFAMTSLPGRPDPGFPAPKATAKSVPMIHATDLFRPPDDPDDHWDLASVYALAYRGLVELKAILIDHPVRRHGNDPDVLAVAQMNYLTGLCVPCAVGPSKRFSSRKDKLADSAPAEVAAIDFLLSLLRDAKGPVLINITGSCRTVAAAGNRDPELFAKKCAAIYLNAGVGSPDPAKAAQREYNVGLDPLAYAAIFDLPCPVYWLPCFEDLGERLPDGGWPVRQFGSYYRFRHEQIMPHLSDRVANFFTFMYRGGRTRKQGWPGATRWLQHLSGPRDRDEEARVAKSWRNMWCTAGFLHAAELTVTRAGKLASRDNQGEAVFEFVPVQVTCSDRGVTTWRLSHRPTNRFILRVRDTASYGSAMTEGLKELLSYLP